MYSCKQAVKDHVQAMSPVSIASIRQYCRAQASDYNVKTFLRALVELEREGFMCRDKEAEGVVYELADNWEQAVRDSVAPKGNNMMNQFTVIVIRTAHKEFRLLALNGDAVKTLSSEWI
jgi:hypothetical protein